MRSFVFASSLLLLVVGSGCSESHGVPNTESDSGLIGDAIVVLDGGPPTGMCPSDINPWNPMDPHSQCTIEGATCTSGSSDACGSFMSCRCETGHWNCAVAEPDPVCWCGRQPAVGDRCSTDGMACGQCCPTPGGNGWPLMTCVAGHWQAAACTADCPAPPPFECPADTAPLVGASCWNEGAHCGDACCADSVTCTGGVWIRGPEADCFACTEYACGEGFCRADQTCRSQCGPTDGIEFLCDERDTTCNDCSCIPLTASQRCEMVDGHPHVSETGICG